MRAAARQHPFLGRGPGLERLGGRRDEPWPGAAGRDPAARAVRDAIDQRVKQPVVYDPALSTAHTRNLGAGGRFVKERTELKHLSVSKIHAYNTSGRGIYQLKENQV